MAALHGDPSPKSPADPSSIGISFMALDCISIPIVALVTLVAEMDAISENSSRSITSKSCGAESASHLG